MIRKDFLSVLRKSLILLFKKSLTSLFLETHQDHWFLTQTWIQKSRPLLIKGDSNKIMIRMEQASNQGDEDWRRTLKKNSLKTNLEEIRPLC